MRGLVCGSGRNRQMGIFLVFDYVWARWNSVGRIEVRECRTDGLVRKCIIYSQLTGCVDK